MRFTILTIASRPHFLPSVGRSIATAIKPADVDVRWLVKFNPEHKLEWSEHIAIWNKTLRELTGTWVILLSDDNLLHPSVIQRWREIIEHSPAKMLHFRQQFGPCNFRPAGLDHLDGGYCDGGQIVFDADYYNSFGWSYDEFGFEGFLFRRMYESNPAAFYFHDELLTYHDRLLW